jgi:hypothetical protein
MRNLAELEKDICFLPEVRDLEGLALLSLRIALKSYFSTYKCVRGQLNKFESEYKHGQQVIDFNTLGSEYIENCAETVVHFQHFVELVCKDLLRREHELLALKGSSALSDPVVFYNLLAGKHVDQGKLTTKTTVSLGEALQRLCGLITAGLIRDDQAGFVKRYESALNVLNRLRNEIWHRGISILRYRALDEFIGRCILPFVLEVVGLPGYADKTVFWKYQAVDCGVDPLDSIVNHLLANQYDLRKVAFLKELGRAAYVNPIRESRISYAPHIVLTNRPVQERRAQQLVGEELKENWWAKAIRCPVCGLKSLIIFEEEEQAVPYIERGECKCCTFQIDGELARPKDLGLPLENWG